MNGKNNLHDETSLMLRTPYLNLLTFPMNMFPSLSWTYVSIDLMSSSVLLQL